MTLDDFVPFWPSHFDRAFIKMKSDLAKLFSTLWGHTLRLSEVSFKNDRGFMLCNDGILSVHNDASALSFFLNGW